MPTLSEAGRMIRNAYRAVNDANGQPVLKPGFTDPDDWTLVRVIDNTANGGDAVSIYVSTPNPERAEYELLQVFIAGRGTASLNDALPDLRIAVGLSPSDRIADAENILAQVRAAYPGASISAGGHSLDGYVWARVSENQANIPGAAPLFVLALNPPNSFVSSSIDGNVLAISARYDLVGHYGASYSNAITLDTNVPGGFLNQLGTHSVDQLVTQGIDLNPVLKNTQLGQPIDVQGVIAGGNVSSVQLSRLSGWESSTAPSDFVTNATINWFDTMSAPPELGFVEPPPPPPAPAPPNPPELGFVAPSPLAPPLALPEAPPAPDVPPGAPSLSAPSPVPDDPFNPVSGPDPGMFDPGFVAPSPLPPPPALPEPPPIAYEPPPAPYVPPPVEEIWFPDLPPVPPPPPLYELSPISYEPPPVVYDSFYEPPPTVYMPPLSWYEPPPPVYIPPPPVYEPQPVFYEPEPTFYEPPPVFYEPPPISYDFFSSFNFFFFGFPIVVDLDGAGLDLVSLATSATFFDMDGDGVRDQTGWVGPGDGLLVVDFDHDGQIGDINEISFARFGESGATDLEGFAAAFDSNHDGVFEASDQRFDELLVWCDANQDGQSDPGELKSLADWGITAIGLERQGSAVGEIPVPLDNFMFGTSTFTWADGSVGTVGDVAFAFKTEAAGGVGEDVLAAGAGVDPTGEAMNSAAASHEWDDPRVEQLRQAMAAFSPPALSADMTLLSDIQHPLTPALAAAGHS